MFRGQKPEVYDSWGDCSEYVVGYNGVAYRNYVTWWEAEVAYATFLNNITKIASQNKLPNFEIGKF
jgi:viroplasmin and RNaseH domain-containing protein